MKIIIFLIFISVVVPISGCQSLGSKTNQEDSDDNDDEDGAKEVKNENKEKKLEVDTVELKQARIWARLDELESLVHKQKERIQLLERGLMLGIVPDELKNERTKSGKHPSEKGETSESKRPEMPSAEAIPSANSSGNEALRKAMSLAQELFKSGRLGKAYLEYARIDKDYDPSLTHGDPKYWLGRCWLKLKEYQSARQSLQAFIKDFASNPLTPSAKYYLAETELNMDMKELAVNHLQEVIKNYPADGSSEEAKLLLDKIRKTM